MGAQSGRSSYSGNRSRGSHRKRGRKKKLNLKALFRWGMVLFVLLAAFCILIQLPGRKTESKTAGSYEKTVGKTIEERPELDVQLIDINPYSRPGTKSNKITGIVVHYTANPGSTAKQNRDYFAGLAEEKTTKASSHFVIGLEGEIVQCVPCDEIAYCSNERNIDTVSIECCIEDESGVFNQKTYDSLVELVSWLVCRYELSVDDVIRHYDVTGKICPKDFVEHPEKWDAFKADVAEYIEAHAK